MIDFDLKSYAKTILPTGEYTFAVSNPELKNTKKNDGKYLEIKLTVISEFMRGGVVFKKFNLYNPSGTAERIAREHFAAFSEAIRMPEIKSYSQVDGAIVKGLVNEVFDSYGNPQNEVSKFIQCSPGEATERPPVEEKFNDDIPF